jgi:hypothetical protein
MAAQTSELHEAFSKYKPENFAEIIDKLVGDKNNLRVDIQAVKFTLQKQTYEINGTLNFNVIHKTPNTPAPSKEGKL